MSSSTHGYRWFDSLALAIEDDLGRRRKCGMKELTSAVTV